MCECKCPSEGLQSFCGLSPPGPLLQSLQKVVRRCENTAGDPALDSQWASGGAANTPQTQKWKQLKENRSQDEKAGTESWHRQSDFHIWDIFCFISGRKWWHMVHLYKQSILKSFRHIRQIHPVNATKLLKYSMIFSHLPYCATSWSQGWLC